MSTSLTTKRTGYVDINVWFSYSRDNLHGLRWFLLSYVYLKYIFNSQNTTTLTADPTLVRQTFNISGYVNATEQDKAITQRCEPCTTVLPNGLNTL